MPDTDKMNTKIFKEYAKQLKENLVTAAQLKENLVTEVQLGQLEQMQAKANLIEHLHYLCSDLDVWYEKDKSGKYKPLNAKNVERLNKFYDACIEIAKKIDDDATRNILRILEKDKSKLRSVPKMGEYNLPSILYEARKQNFSTASLKEAKAVGGALSKRIPIEYKDKEGKQHKGFFSEGTEQNLADRIALKKAEMKGRYQKLPITNLLEVLGPNDSAWRNFHRLFLFKKKEKDEFVTQLLNLSIVGADSPQRKWESFKSYLKKEIDIPEQFFTSTQQAYQVNAASKNTEAYQQMMADIVGAIQDIGRDFPRLYNAATLYQSAGVVEYSDITDRNCSMSILAGLLGREDLIAFSTPANLRVGDSGETVNGIFMENVEEASVSSQDLKNPMLLKDVADLQIIDYICGNIDRHSGNFFFVKRTDGRVGIKGIDNDLSFGIIPLKGGIQELASINDIRRISSSMAKKVLEINRQEIEYLLRTSSLSEAEKNAVWERTQELKRRIFTNSKKNISKPIQIIQDDQWKEFSIEELELKGKPDLYAYVNSKADRMINKSKGSRTRSEVSFLECEEVDDSQSTIKQTSIVEMWKKSAVRNYGLSKFELQSYTEKVGECMDKLVSADSWVFFGSNEYDKMRDQVRVLQKIMQSLCKREDKLSLKNLLVLKRSLNLSVNATETYLQKKDGQILNETGKIRVNTAIEVKKMCTECLTWMDQFIKNKYAYNLNKKLMDKKILKSEKPETLLEVCQNVIKLVGEKQGVRSEVDFERDCNALHTLWKVALPTSEEVKPEEIRDAFDNIRKIDPDVARLTMENLNKSSTEDITSPKDVRAFLDDFLLQLAVKNRIETKDLLKPLEKKERLPETHVQSPMRK